MQRLYYVLRVEGNIRKYERKSLSVFFSDKLFKPLSPSSQFIIKAFDYLFTLKSGRCLPR